jgi:cytochrome c553
MIIRSLQIKVAACLLTTMSVTLPLMAAERAEAPPIPDHGTATVDACYACHNSALAKSHMEKNGASLMTPQNRADNGSYTQACGICHGPGRSADIDLVHGH